MLDTNDIDTFVALFIKAEIGNASEITKIAKTLHTESNDGLDAAEFWRLAQSMQIAAHLGEVAQEEANVATIIADNLESGVCHPFSQDQAWLDAISIAKAINGRSPRPRIPERTIGVAASCARLKKNGRSISVNAFGPSWDQQSLKDACREIDSLAQLIGGEVIIKQLGYAKDKTNQIYDELWLFGETGLGVLEMKEPSLPEGWLLALAAKHMGQANIARKPEKCWQSLRTKMSDVASTFDCERYSQFEQLDIHPADFFRSVQSALLWKELFTAAQAPSRALPYIRDAFNKLLVLDKHADFLALLKLLWSEFDALSRQTVYGGSLSMTVVEANRDFPNLMEHSYARNGDINRNYIVPFDECATNDGRFVLFQGPTEKVLVRPTSITNSAFLETVFRLMWRLLKKDAEKLSGGVVEFALKLACTNKADKLLSCEKYTVGKETFEMDIAARSQSNVTLIEAKSKSLTDQSRSGDMFSFLSDLSKSYFPMMTQLARHEKHLKAGLTALASIGDPIGELKIEKIAVSPLSYGPVGDKILASAIHRSLVNYNLVSIEDDPQKAKIISDFNNAYKDSINEIKTVAPKQDDRVEFHAYFLHTNWVDLGQMLYALDRANSVADALGPMRHISFMSRDFWTEVAYSDKQTLLSGRWKSLEE
ncbi:hypothetical protein ATL17_0176 [Maritalea mobilis]|jgi:hypothetical protein|uniref:Uncharacterized protein n=1 Tax=Maritalea mobilis TaxID=483324 RepID=A0A4R6VQA5_9HYPH|nr:hypothetical protein [Maritalea mobilis]TDQ66189.1 hypothetical protein ATL17_0176 [Maritalea mobilis]